MFNQELETSGLKGVGFLKWFARYGDRGKRPGHWMLMISLGYSKMTPRAGPIPHILHVGYGVEWRMDWGWFGIALGMAFTPGQLHNGSDRRQCQQTTQHQENEWP